MRRNMIGYVVISVLILLIIIQIMVGYASRRELKRESAGIIIKADYCIFIEIEDKTLYLLQNGKCIKKYPIASGKPGWPSPIGFWKIVNKGDWGKGFGGRWLGLNVTWGTYGIHGTIFDESIGSAASHGCIRMHNKDIKELYAKVRVGTPVVIVNGCFGAFGRGFSSISPGDRGATVMAIQRRLKNLGYFKGRLSGIYEDDLKYALHKFQKTKGLKVKDTVTKKDYLSMGFKEFE